VEIDAGIVVSPKSGELVLVVRVKLSKVAVVIVPAACDVTARPTYTVEAIAIVSALPMCVAKTRLRVGINNLRFREQ
jgi:hypothetical protein